jgi:hypothetical protein
MALLRNDSFERIWKEVVLASLEIRDLSGGIKEFFIQDPHSTEILTRRLQNINDEEATAAPEPTRSALSTSIC